jgi:hypothetical protein
MGAAGGGFGVASLAQWDHQRNGKAGGLSWIGGAAVVVIGGLWTGITYFVDHKAEHGEGPSKEQIEQIQKPLAEQLAAQNALIKMLLEKNPTAAPGAQQAVGAALQSIAQGAEAGETRLEKALGLLKENKLAEATRLLTAVAGDKEATRGEGHGAGRKGPQGSRDCLPQPRRDRGPCRSQARARGLRKGSFARSGRYSEPVLDRMDSDRLRRSFKGANAT